MYIEFFCEYMRPIIIIATTISLANPFDTTTNVCDTRYI